jgi:hypothetical protein
VDSDSRVVDPTWKNGGTAYVGIEEVDPAAYAERSLAQGSYPLEVATFAPQHILSELWAVVVPEMSLGPVRGTSRSPQPEKRLGIKADEGTRTLDLLHGKQTL